MGEIFEQYEVCSWKVADRDLIAVPVIKIREERGKRIVEHERPYRPGAKLDDTDWEVRRWILTVKFDNSIEEEGIPADPPLYPTILNRLLDSYDEKETGDLVLPTRGTRRCRLKGYSRVETPEEDDAAVCEFTFFEDSEDVIDLDSLDNPTVRATAVRLSEQTTFSSQGVSGWDTNSSSLTEFASELEGLLLAPGRAVEDVNSVARRNRRAIQRVQRAQEQLGRDVGGIYNDPEGSTPIRELRRLDDLQAQAVDERTSGRPKTTLHNITANTDIFSVAADIGQDPNELMDLNAARIEDPLDLRAGDTIRIFESGP